MDAYAYRAIVYILTKNFDYAAADLYQAFMCIPSFFDSITNDKNLTKSYFVRSPLELTDVVKFLSKNFQDNLQ